MTNRVVLGALPGGGHGLRVSRPGYDVLNTGLTGQQLSFDSRWAATARLFLNGSVTLGVTSAGVYHTVSFGTTFASVPPTIIMFRNTSGSAWAPVDGTQHNGFTSTGNFFFEKARVYTDRIELMHPFTGSSQEFCYLVMRPD